MDHFEYVASKVWINSNNYMIQIRSVKFWLIEALIIGSEYSVTTPVLIEDVNAMVARVVCSNYIRTIATVVYVFHLISYPVIQEKFVPGR